MARKKGHWQKAAVIFQPATHQGWQRGIDQIVNAIRPTLGPLPRVVMYDTTVGTTSRRPELLDDGGTIARRIIQIADRDADVGAMLIRHMLWELHQQVGDGTATAAVLFQAIYNAGVRYLTAGGNAMLLRQHMERGMRVILDALAAQKQDIAGPESLTQLAYSICYDEKLARLLGEIFDVIGAYGRLELRNSHGRYMDREYVEGMYWSSNLLSRSMINNQKRLRAELETPVIVATDLDIVDPKDLVPLLGICVSGKKDHLIIIARKLSATVLGLLAANQRAGRLNVEVVGAKTPGVGADSQREALYDIGILIGAVPIFKATGQTLRNIRGENLGRARRIWLDHHNLGIIGGKGNPRKLRQHITGLRHRYKNTHAPTERDTLQQRIGKLMGGSATLWLAGLTQTEIEFSKKLAQRTAAAMRGAMQEGIVPGGGVALLACRPALAQAFANNNTAEARAAYRILNQALDAPLRALLQNAGHDPGTVMADILQAGLGYGFDVHQNAIVNINTTGLFDAAAVTIAAAHSAISTAALALTTDVMVHRRAAPDGAITT